MLKKLVVYDNRDCIIFQCFLENGLRYEENKDGETLYNIFLYCDDTFIGTLSTYKGRVELKDYIITENCDYIEKEARTW